jgi:outer membrane protein assembly factor BamB
MRQARQNRAILLLLLSSLLVLSSCSEPGPQPTPTPARPNISTVTAPEVIWSFEPDEPVSGLRADGGILYAVAGHSLFALDALSGQEKWHTELGDGTQGFTVGVHQGTPYVAMDTKELLALDPTTGKVQRSTDLPEAVIIGIGPRGAGDVLCMSGQKDWQSPSYLFCVDRNTGAERWRLEIGKDPAFPTIVGDTIYAIVSQTLHAFDLATGTEKWKYEPCRTLSWGLQVDGGVVYVRGEQTIYAVDAVTGQERWTHRLERQIASDIPVADGMMYFQSGAALQAMDTRTRTVKWQAKSDDVLGHSITVRDGVLYVGGDNFVHAFDAATGAEKWRFVVKQSDRSLPVVENGLLYIAGDYGEHHDGLYALGAR